MLPSRRSLGLDLGGSGGAAVYVPGLRQWDTQVSFRSLSLRLDESRSGGVTRLKGRLDFDSLTVDNRSLAPVPVWMRQLAVDCDAAVGADYAELADGSSFSFNGFSFSPSIRVQKPAGEDWKVRLAVEQPFFPAQQFFDALPAALFESLAGIRTEGKLAWHFLLDADFDRLDSLRLENSVRTEGFRTKCCSKPSCSRRTVRFTGMKASVSKRSGWLWCMICASAASPVAEAPYRCSW